ncbi:MAG TPA: hypothetical protein VFA38_08835 [Nitrospirales bacterium]|nr:hypothetical protein [Nitrospirales bacterium]
MILSRSVKDCNRQIVGTVVFLSHSERGATAYLRVVSDGMEHLFEIPWHLVGANYRSHCFTIMMSKEELLEALELTEPDHDVRHGVC